MNYDEACRRLRNHANLPNSGPDDESLGFALWRASRGQPQTEFVALFEDVIECLECVNLALNGETPSETPNARKRSDIDRWLCYSISCLFDIQLKGLQSMATDYHELVLSMARNLSIAWSCVLAGDVDEISTQLDPN